MIHPSARKPSSPRKRPAAGRPSVAKRAPRRRNGRGKKRPDYRHLVQTLLIRLGVLAVAGLLGYFAYIYVFAPFRSKWQARYGNEIYPEGYSIRGIDISHHQGDIDWEKLSKASIGKEGVSFVFIKATEGRSYMDENFNDNFFEARENGMIRGAYHYFKPAVPAREQAAYFLKQVHLEPGDLPPVLDIEEKGDLNAVQLQKAAKAWLDMVEEKYGVPPILYTNYKFKEAYLNTENFQRFPYWIAHYYVHNLVYKGAWKFWQHTDCGKLDGIKGQVDLNIYNGSMYDLRRLCLPEVDDED